MLHDVRQGGKKRRKKATTVAGVARRGPGTRVAADENPGEGLHLGTGIAADENRKWPLQDLPSKLVADVLGCSGMKHLFAVCVLAQAEN